MKRILIANRSEIAYRVIATCKEMGIETVAIYAENDQNLPYVKAADFSCSLGEGPLSETYLNGENILEIAKKMNCEGVHPGYGLLSENGHFAKMCQEKGVTFIGPSVKSIQVMGDKVSSKQALEKTKVPLIPGYFGQNQDPSFLKDEAKKVGLPLLIKASAGGGGKGMRIVHSLDQFEEGLASAQREALKAFGDQTVMLERYIQKARHIEVQVFGDQKGHVVHLFERECSVQRRHQKVIEETPAPCLSEKKRQEICQSAIEVAKTIDYYGAGTVEFIFDEVSEEFFFLEMNTRLQVEHPITEELTGVDLVSWQIQVARGQELPLKQEEIRPKGHALECRLYAENPDEHFLPTVGTLKGLSFSPLPGARYDLGPREGNEITMDYDPMIGKVIATSLTREGVIAKMKQMLSALVVEGLITNREYLNRILSSEVFQRGEVTTDFIEKNQEVFASSPTSEEKAESLGAYFLTQKEVSSRSQQSERGESLSSSWESLRKGQVL